MCVLGLNSGQQVWWQTVFTLWAIPLHVQWLLARCKSPPQIDSRKEGKLRHGSLCSDLSLTACLFLRKNGIQFLFRLQIQFLFIKETIHLFLELPSRQWLSLVVYSNQKLNWMTVILVTFLTLMCLWQPGTYGSTIIRFILFTVQFPWSPESSLCSMST